MTEDNGDNESWPGAEVDPGDELYEPEKWSLAWWFSTHKPPKPMKRSPFRKLAVGITLVICLIWMASQTVCSSGPI